MGEIPAEQLRQEHRERCCREDRYCARAQRDSRIQGRLDPGIRWDIYETCVRWQYGSEPDRSGYYLIAKAIPYLDPLTGEPTGKHCRYVELAAWDTADALGVWEDTNNPEYIYAYCKEPSLPPMPNRFEMKAGDDGKMHKTWWYEE